MRLAMVRVSIRSMTLHPMHTKPPSALQRHNTLRPNRNLRNGAALRTAVRCEDPRHPRQDDETYILRHHTVRALTHLKRLPKLNEACQGAVPALLPLRLPT